MWLSKSKGFMGFIVVLLDVSDSDRIVRKEHYVQGSRLLMTPMPRQVCYSYVDCSILDIVSGKCLIKQLTVQFQYRIKFIARLQYQKLLGWCIHVHALKTTALLMITNAISKPLEIDNVMVCPYNSAIVHNNMQR